jgi:hypothetical protein
MLDQQAGMWRQFARASQAEGQVPPRPRLVQRYGADRHALQIGQRALRHARHSDRGLDHTADCADAAHMGAMAQAKTTPRSVLAQIALQRGIQEADKGLSYRFRETDRISA